MGKKERKKERKKEKNRERDRKRKRQREREKETCLTYGTVVQVSCGVSVVCLRESPTSVKPSGNIMIVEMSSHQQKPDPQPKQQQQNQQQQQQPQLPQSK